MLRVGQHRNQCVFDERVPVGFPGRKRNSSPCPSHGSCMVFEVRSGPLSASTITDLLEAVGLQLECAPTHRQAAKCATAGQPIAPEMTLKRKRCASQATSAAVLCKCLCELLGRIDLPAPSTRNRSSDVAHTFVNAPAKDQGLHQDQAMARLIAVDVVAARFFVPRQPIRRRFG